MPQWLVLAATLGSLAALVGAYWDDAWHTERGRDAFLIAPHVAIYAGVSLVAGALGLRVLGAIRRAGVRTVTTDRSLALATVSVAATLASAPIDNAWHLGFGRDAVLWSPPHMLGIVGTLGLGAALLSEMGRRPVMGPLVGGLVLAAATFPVAEYETGVPQFDAVWFLPALGVGAVVGFGLIGQTAEEGRRPRARAALVHFGFLAAVSGLLLVLGFDAPALPLLVVPAVIADEVRLRGWKPLPRAAAFAASLFAVYVPVRDGLEADVQLDFADVLAGLPFAILAVWLVERLLEPTGEGVGRRVAITTVLVAMLLAPVSIAVAHDPGQGKDAGLARLAVSNAGHVVNLQGRLLRANCNGLSSGVVIARRAGATLRAPLRLDGCSFGGALTLRERGRWFVYADLRVRRQLVETWLPVRVDRERHRVASAHRFAYVPRAPADPFLKYAAGALLYIAMFGLLLAAMRLLRSQTK